MKFKITSTGKIRLFNGKLVLTEGATPLPDQQPATTISLTDVSKDRILFQRTSGNFYDVSVTGTTNGTAKIEARAIDAVTGSPVVDWTVIDPTPNSSFSGTLRCPARVPSMKLEVRDGINNSINSSGTNRFFVGAYWVWCGQSNAVNMPTTPAGRPTSGVGSLEYIGGVYKRLGTYSTTEAFPANTISSTYGSNGTIVAEDGTRRGDGYVYMANVLSERLGCAVCLISSASVGQPIRFWNTGDTGWTNLTNLISAVGGDIEGLTLYQGEQDSVENTTFDNYLSALNSFHSRLLSYIGRTVSNFKMGIVSLGAVDATSGYANGISNVRAAQVYFANNTQGAFLAASNHDSTTTDSVHTRGSSYAHLGPAIGCSMAAQYGFGPSGAGPRVISATRSGAVITLNVQHAGGTALVDGTGGNGSALTGFRVFDGGVAAAINGTAITSPTTIQITLSTVPVDTVTVDYAMVAAPHAADQINPRVDPVWASAVYDNVPLVNNTRGCILQPFAAITVTGA